jgi:Ca2+-binding EF-hand superfamily protein
MIAILPVLLLAAQAEAAPATASGGERVQIFIAPSGEPFRIHGNAVAAWFAGADKNSDGKLDPDEFTADFMRFFDQLDVNHDGAIDSVERARYENEIAPETLGGSFSYDYQPAQQEDDTDIAGQGAASNDTGPVTSARKPRYGSNPVGAARFDLLGFPEPVASMDTELRGRISRRAAEEAAHDRFALLDEGHSGYLTLDGLPPTYARYGNSSGGRKRGKRAR